MSITGRFSSLPFMCVNNSAFCLRSWQSMQLLQQTRAVNCILILSMLGKFSAAFFRINFFSKQPFRNTIRMSNVLAPDQGKRSVGSDLGPNVCKGNR